MSQIPLHNGRDHSANLFQKALVGLVALAGILGLVTFFSGSESDALLITTTIMWSAAFVLMLITDQHNAWFIALGLFATGVFTGIFSFAELPHAIEFVVLGFIGAVLIALSINRLFGTFDWIGFLLIQRSKTFRSLLILSGILGGVQAFLFDEGSSVGSMAMILGPVLAGVMVEVGKYHDPDLVDPEEAEIAGRVFSISTMNFVFMTNILAFILAIGHPVSLTIARYAGWDIPFWVIYVMPISIACYLVTYAVFYTMHRKSIAEYDKFYQGYRNYKLAKGFEVTTRHKIGLAYLVIMGALQFGHQFLADALHQPHEVTLTLFPAIMSVIMGCHVYLFDHHKLHSVLDELPVGEFINMAGIFTMAYMLGVVGVLGWIARKITPMALVAGIFVLGGTSGILSALLENLGVAVAVNTVVDQIFGGVQNTTPIRLSVMIQAMLAGNMFTFASVAGLVGIPLLQAFTSMKLGAYADREEKWHIYDPFIIKVREGVPVRRWLKSSVIIVLLTIITAMCMIYGVDKTIGYPEGVYYCQYSDNADGCIEGAPGHHGASESESGEH